MDLPLERQRSRDLIVIIERDCLTRENFEQLNRKMSYDVSYSTLNYATKLACDRLADEFDRREIKRKSVDDRILGAEVLSLTDEMKVINRIVDLGGVGAVHRERYKEAIRAGVRLRRAIIDASKKQAFLRAVAEKARQDLGPVSK